MGGVINLRDFRQCLRLSVESVSLLDPLLVCEDKGQNLPILIESLEQAFARIFFAACGESCYIG
jgi:hypothetical protein